MFGSSKLEGRRIAVLVADGFEKIELTMPMSALRAAGAEVDIISLRNGSIRAMNMHEPAGKIAVDYAIDEVDPDDYDGLLIPGGFINPDLLRQSADAREFVRAFDRRRKPIATLCHGPWLLASAGLTRGRTMTSWPGIRDDMVHAGATWLDQKLVRDGNWITSRGPQDMKAFIRGMRELFAETAPIVSVPSFALSSSPQRASPPKLAAGAVNLLPLPSLRTIALLAIVGAGVAGMAKRAPQQS
ncbi:type 1 glutamine amidotransferase domain-containing protein [Noviherbaspirillum pedocola]|uniref:Type 1 glutamine amidotransferase n=1 Tax=Noviherbaspirillum pedocola TaxID=2801341 RepID=A0A934SWQ2_9BURK|nr:type 1 glutamine amidotransferase domain-containing protein [Noviherbaspirillum pedocola]MBK4738211.1 type 1 glutamine amidotransferase [Noviherbaspirillum pedocola]